MQSFILTFISQKKFGFLRKIFLEKQYFLDGKG
jgi:hypothetical protein